MLMVFLSEILILDICRAATWLSVHMFTSYYAIAMASKADANFGRVVLQSLFKWTRSPTSRVCGIHGCIYSKKNK